MKQIYNIYHAEHPTFDESFEGNRIYVGSVEANSLEQAYAKSQNIEWPWNIDKPCRSTSIGDVIQCEDQFHMVAGVGFIQVATEPLSNEPTPEFGNWECGEGTLHSHNEQCDCVRYEPTEADCWNGEPYSE